MHRLLRSGDANQVRLRHLSLTSSKGLLDAPAALRLPAPHNQQHDPADHTKPAQDRREIDPVSFLVLDFNRAELRVLFLSVPTQPPVGKTDDADDD